MPELIFQKDSQCIWSEHSSVRLILGKDMGHTVRVSCFKSQLPHHRVEIPAPSVANFVGAVVGFWPARKRRIENPQP